MIKKNDASHEQSLDFKIMNINDSFETNMTHSGTNVILYTLTIFKVFMINKYSMKIPFFFLILLKFATNAFYIFISIICKEFCISINYICVINNLSY